MDANAAVYVQAEPLSGKAVRRFWIAWLVCLLIMLAGLVIIVLIAAVAADPASVSPPG